MNVKHVVMFSGGVGSWAAAKRVVERHGKDGVALLFADTMYEDADLYRFIDEAAENVGVPLFRVCDGRTPWEVFHDVRFLGNSRVDPCSKHLKRDIMDRWRDEHCDPAETTIYLGIDWSEKHRLTRVQGRVAPWRYEAPMCDRPCLTKAGMIHWLESEGIRPPRLYTLGFPHNNCGGFCIKAGHSQFRLLLDRMPDVYARNEQQEELIRDLLGDVAVMRSRVGGESKPMTMKQFRQRIQREPNLFADDDWGGCGCAIDDNETECEGNNA